MKEWVTLAITGVQKQSEAALLHVRVDEVVKHELFTLNCQVVLRGGMGYRVFTLYQLDIYPRSPV